MGADKPDGTWAPDVDAVRQAEKQERAPTQREALRVWFLLIGWLASLVLLTAAVLRPTGEGGEFPVLFVLLLVNLGVPFLLVPLLRRWDRRRFVFAFVVWLLFTGPFVLAICLSVVGAAVEAVG